MYNIDNFGAIGDGKTIETECIQRVIDQCSQSGGGLVFVPAGIYKVGTIFLKNNVTLYLDNGAQIVGSEDINHYSKDVLLFTDAVKTERGHCVIYAKDLTNVSIEGKGTIVGQGTCYPDEPGVARPMLLRFINCERVTVKDIVLKDSAAWIQHYHLCKDVVVDGVSVKSKANGNNDGINIDGCENVRVSNCSFNCGDDGITLKTTTNIPCKNVTITNCTVHSDCNGIKFGTESIGDFNNVTISNCTIYDTRLGGIMLISMDGAKLENVVISNIVMNGVGTPIFMRLGNRNYSAISESDTKPVGVIRNITISNIQATGANVIGGSITGLPGHCLENITLSDINITCNGGGTESDAKKLVPELPKDYPDYFVYGVLPSYGLFCRHIKGLVMKNVSYRCSCHDARPALIFFDVEGLELTQFKTVNYWEKQPIIRMADVSNVFIFGNRVDSSVKKFLKVEGSNISGISIVGNDFSQLENVIEVEGELYGDAIRNEGNLSYNTVASRCINKKY